MANALSEAFKETNNTELNVGTAFDPDYKKVLADLALKAHETNSSLDAKSMEDDFKKTLKENVSIDDVWEYLTQNKCQNTAIVEGFLKFFLGKIGENEITIAQFLKTREVKSDARESLNKSYLELRTKILGESMQAFAALQASVLKNKGAPQKLPEAPSQQV